MTPRAVAGRFRLRELASLHANLRGLFLLALLLTASLLAYIFVRVRLVGDLLSPLDFASMCLFALAAVLLCYVQLRCLRQLRCETRRKVERLTFVDPLSGVYNFRYLRQRLREEFARARRLREPLAVIFLDFDHFKDVNDTFGHAEGNAVLEKVGGALRRAVRGEDFVGRLGGDEFLVVLPQTTRDGAVRAAERLKAALDALEWRTADGRDAGFLTFSMGVAAFPEDASAIEPLLSKADKALYKAKALGGNCVAHHTDGIPPANDPGAILLDVGTCLRPDPPRQEASTRGS